MSNTGRGGRRGRRNVTSSRDVHKIVSKILRRDLLTTEPGWKSLKVRNFDPPNFTSEPIFTRRIRYVVAGAAAGNEIQIQALGQAYGMNRVFKYVSVSRIDVYGDANDSTLEVQVTQDMAGSPKKFFVDTGVTGARRSHVAIVTAAKDRPWNLIASTDLLIKTRSVAANGTYEDFDYVVDFMAHYYGNVVISPPNCAAHLSLRSLPQVRTVQSNFVNPSDELVEHQADISKLKIDTADDADFVSI